jgi:hypothetical protein
MRMHRATVSSCLDAPGILTDPGVLTDTVPSDSVAGRTSGADTTFSEWTVDLVTPQVPGVTPTLVGAAGYVDFDVIDSVHG